jgi:Flp pilus assembly protein TadG
MVALGLAALCAATAMAIDIGALAVAKTQCQAAADAAALAGARSLDGSSSGNTTTATTNAKNVAAANKILSQSIAASEVTVTHGAYHYDATTLAFTAQYPPVDPDNYNLTKVEITHPVPSFFSRAFSGIGYSVTCSAVAAHRPRDVTIVLDYSGSMNNESDLWNNESYLGSVNNSPNNTDTVVPSFGAYSSSGATLISTSTDARVGKCNITQTTLGISPLVNDFYQNNRSATTTAAFVNVPYTNLYTPPSGDQYCATAGTSTTPPTFAKTIQDITGSTATQITNKTDAAFNGYMNSSGTYVCNGYTQGPGYWGMTFFIWPPDPDYNTAGTPSSDINTRSGYPASLTSPPQDWRRRFFLRSGGSYPSFGGQVDDNTLLWDSSGNWRDPVDSNGTNYVINYQAILAWIRANCVQSTTTDNKPFPTQLRAGGILYYGSVPTDVPSTAYTWTSANNLITDNTQRFWKEYIDYVLGVWRDPYGNIQRPGNPACSIGPDFTWGTIRVSAPVSGYAATPTTRMHPQDNPKRPRHRFWFGPMTMIQYMSDTGLLPGTAHDISMVAAKLGIQGALTDIQNNHPNDLVSLILFSRPNYHGEPTEAGAFSQATIGLSRNYSGMIRSLYFPPNSTASDVRPWDANGLQTPRAHGDYIANTATSYGLMLAYNQFSSNSTLRSNAVGGSGRKGAQRMVILETDGMANQASTATFNASGLNSYYSLSASDNVTPSSSSAGQQALDVATRICAQTSDTTNGPGFATPGKPVLIHCIGFGAVFETTASGSEPANALAFLRNLSSIGGTGFPASLTDTSDPYAYKLCTGTLQQRQDKLRTAFRKVMDDGVNIILVK